MLRQVNDLYDYKVQTTDKQAGTVHDLYFDPDNWEVLYLVVDTGTWLPGRKVILSLESLAEPRWEAKVLPVNLTQAQFRESPDINTAKGFSYVDEHRLRSHYNLPSLSRTGGGLFEEEIAGMDPDSISGLVRAKTEEAEAIRKHENRLHLQSVREVSGYYLHAQDGEIGHVEDFVVDTRAWMLRYMVVDTRNWLPGRKVILSTSWVENIDWRDSMVYVNLSREQVKNSPEYDPSIPLSREYETELHEHYDQVEYWR